jgi:receptor protein-tyrosine kinase
VSSERISRVLSRSWRSALGVAVSGALVALAACFVLPQRYEATADVLLTPANAAATEGAVDERLLRSYALVLGGRTTAETVRDAIEADQSVGTIDDALDGSVVSGTSVLRATARSGDADQAAAISRAAAEALVDQLVEREIAIASPPSTDDEGDDTEQDVPPTVTVAASVVEQSAVPSSPVSPSIPWWVTIGAIIGALVGLLGSAVRQLTDRLVRSSDDLAEVTSAPMLTAVGYDRHTAQKPLVSDLDPQAPRFEATRILRTHLQFLDVDSTNTVLTVTSSMSGEGKTTMAANLAIALAHGGDRVVLVDADLRRPRLAELFELSGTDGLTTALVGAVDLEHAVQQTRVPGLEVLTTGRLPPNPTELLQTQAMSDLITSLQRRYDVVVLDAPPLLPVADAAVLAAMSDGALVLVRHGRTTREQVRAAAGRLEAVGANLWGTVLTMVPARSLAPYGYGYGYGDAPRRSSRSEEGRRVRR